MRITHLIIYMLMASLQLQAQDNQRLTVDWKKWERLSSQQLLDKAHNYLVLNEHPDSQLIFYSVVTNRYYANPKDKQLQKHAIVAFNALGQVYQLYFHEYAKAYSNLLIAKKIATDNNYSDILPEIDLRIVGIDHSLKTLLGEEGYREELIGQYKEVFEEAIKAHDFKNMTRAMMNMIAIANEDSLEHTILKEIDTFERIVFPKEEETPQYRFAQIMLRGIKAFMRHDYQTALAEYDKLLDRKVENKTIDLQHQFNYHVMRSIVFMASKQDDKVLQEFDAMEELGFLSNTPEAILSAYHAKWDYYKETVPQKDSCQKYQLLYLELKDSVMNHQKLNSLKETEFLFQLNVANEQMREQAYEQCMQRNILWGVATIAVLLAVFLAVLYHNYRNVRRKNEQLYQRNIELLAADKEKKEMKKKYESSSLTDQGKESLLQKVMSVMETSDEIFQQDFSLARLSALVEADHHHVSQVVNEQPSQGFAALLNDYRIKEACRRMNDTKTYGSLTIEGIANSVGFKSRPYFVKVFKEQTGLTPSAYLKLAKSKNATV